MAGEGGWRSKAVAGRQGGRGSCGARADAVDECGWGIARHEGGCGAGRAVVEGFCRRAWDCAARGRTRRRPAGRPAFPLLCGIADARADAGEADQAPEVSSGARFPSSIIYVDA